MGTDGRGAISLAALKMGGTWGTAVQCGANDGFRLRSSSRTGGKERIPDRSATGKAFGNKSSRGQEIHRITSLTDFRYGGRCAEILAAIMGTAGAPSEVEASYEYTHALSFEDRLGDFFSYCERKGDVRVDEYDSSMISRLVIEITGRGPASLEFEHIASLLTRDDSGTNTLATFASVTIRDPIVPVFLGDCRFRLNDQEAEAIDAADVLKPNLIRLTIDRKLSEDFVADQLVGRGVYQPSETEDPEVYLQIGFPEMVANTYQEWVDDQDMKKADLLITNAAAPLTGAASGLYHQYDFEFPNLEPFEPPENAITGPERIEDGVTFRCIEPDSAPSGMTSTDPFLCTVRNQISTNLLA
jgi:hypothetical protein